MSTIAGGCDPRQGPPLTQIFASIETTQAEHSDTPCGTCWLGLCLIEKKKSVRTRSVSWKGEVP